MRNALPDPDISLRDASDFILDSRLGRKALGCREIPYFPVFLRDLIATIYTLAKSCHLDEFTDHGLPHLCSIIDRISRWTCGQEHGSPVFLCDMLDDHDEDSAGSGAQEAAMLLVASLVHDLGMLSQRPEDLPPGKRQALPKGEGDIPTWVRRTHVQRLPLLFERLFRAQHPSIVNDVLVQRALCIAAAHEKWPWETGHGGLPHRDPGLAAVVAVADLLDEGTNRCDTVTLLQHRQGSLLNQAHWIRHTLTQNHVLVEDGIVRVEMLRPPGTDAQIAPVFAALRNHYRLAMLYVGSLGLLGAGLLNLEFTPASDVPHSEAPSLSRWDKLPALPTQQALCFLLLRSFMPHALLDDRRVSAEDMGHLKSVGMESVDLSGFRQLAGEMEVRTPEEQAFHAICADLTNNG